MRAFSRRDLSVLGRWWWTVDRVSLTLLLSLMIFGGILVAFASPPVAERIGVSPTRFVLKHWIFLGPALIALFVTSLLNLNILRRLGVILFIASIGLLILTLLWGAEIKGATRWLALGGIAIQPSEFLKPCFAITVAWLLSLKQENHQFPGVSLSVLILIISMALLLAQPDLGQASVIATIWFGQLFIAGLPLTVVGGLIILGITGLFLAYSFFPHVQSRITRFLDPESGDTFQITQSIKAIQEGGWFGRGLGEGEIKQTIPDAHSDFILAVAGEELGLLLCLVIVIIFAMIGIRGFYRALNQQSFFAVYAAAGLICQFVFQALVNMGSTLNIIPTKGMTLPFISYGGSSLLATAVAMGALLALTRRNE